MYILQQFLFSFISTVGFSIFFSSPKETLPYTGFTGACGWTIYYITGLLFNSDSVGAFLAALTVGLLGEIFARVNKKPATLYITPGIIPLVPGAGLYYTMSALASKDFLTAANKGVEAFSIASAIAIAIIISSISSQSIKKVRTKD